MREYVTILRRILAGENVTFEGEIFSVRGFQLQMQPPERPARIYMAAIGPQMTRLAGELADGILGYCYSAEYVRDIGAAQPARRRRARGPVARRLRRRLRLPDDRHAGRRRGSSRSRAR